MLNKETLRVVGKRALLPVAFVLGLPFIGYSVIKGYKNFKEKKKGQK